MEHFVPINSPLPNLSNLLRKYIIGLCTLDMTMTTSSTTMSQSSSQRNQQQQQEEQRPLPHEQQRPQHGRTSWKDLRLGEEALGGLSAGIVGTVIGFPLDTVKTRMQTGASASAKNIISTATNPPVPPSPPKNNHSIYQIARSIVKQEGFLSLYKGIGPPLLSLSILGTLTFTQYSYFQDYFQATSGWDGRNFLAGISCSPLAGMISTVENLVKVSICFVHSSVVGGRSAIGTGRSCVV
jgi:Mitochondrial carrier protein